MLDFFDRTTLLIMISALALAVLCVLPETRQITPIWIIAAGLNVGDTLFHELGHAGFAWLLGRPAIPMIFTLFGADQAAGLSISFGRSWYVQIAAFAILAYACVWIRDNYSFLFIPAVIFSLAIVGLAFSDEKYHQVLIAYMGHGTSMLVGGFMLFRAWVYLDSRNQYERWLNALFGFFITFYNIHFAYMLAYDPFFREVYSEHVDFGISHNDFWAIAQLMHGWTVHKIALFTIGYGVAVILIACIAAPLLQDKFSSAPDGIDY